MIKCKSLKAGIEFDNAKEAKIREILQHYYDLKISVAEQEGLVRIKMYLDLIKEITGDKFRKDETLSEQENRILLRKFIYSHTNILPTERDFAEMLLESKPQLKDRHKVIETRSDPETQDRATTRDTLITFKQQIDTDTPYTLIGLIPHIIRQHLEAENILERTIKFAGANEVRSFTMSQSNYYDSFARLIHTIFEVQQQKESSKEIVDLSKLKDAQQEGKQIDEKDEHRRREEIRQKIHEEERRSRL